MSRTELSAAIDLGRMNLGSLAPAQRPAMESWIEEMAAAKRGKRTASLAEILEIRITDPAEAEPLKADLKKHGWWYDRGRKAWLHPRSDEALAYAQSVVASERLMGEA